ncbi:hypothetical protein Tco_1253523 [Tanacetum coccineum]
MEIEGQDMGIQGDARDAYVESPVEYLHKIYVKCGTEVVFNPTLVPSTELLFSTEVFSRSRLSLREVTWNQMPNKTSNYHLVPDA